MDTDLLPVLVHIQSSLDADLSLASLAQRSGMSQSTLKRRIGNATGESPRQHVERLRLERAASQLLLREATILEIALDNGFGSHEVFTRAFSRHFGTTPRGWRGRRSAGSLGSHERQPGLTESTDGVSLSSTRLITMRPVEIAFLRHIGPYGQVEGDSWTRIRHRLRELGRSGDGLPVGIGHDSPDITPPERLRFDAGWTIDEPLPISSGLGQQTIPGGTYAFTTYVGPFALLGQAYAVVTQRLLQHGDTLAFGHDDFSSSVEWYRTGEIDTEHYLNQVDISFPVTAYARGPWSWSAPRILVDDVTPQRQEAEMPDFEFRSVPEQPIAAIRFNTPLDGIGASMAQAFPAIFETVTKAGAVPAGAPLARYHTFGEEVIDYECAIPLAAPWTGDGEVQAGSIGGGETAFGVHVGPYDQLRGTWEALMAWVKEQGREAAGAPWESYVDDPTEVGSDKLRTEIFVPVA